MDWYNENIEPEIRAVVKLLRDNGINTECSCGHEMYVQFQIFPHNDTMSNVDYILYDAGYRDYKINSEIERDRGFLRTNGIVYFKKE